jgi:hypothetical protein
MYNICEKGLRMNESKTSCKVFRRNDNFAQPIVSDIYVPALVLTRASISLN